MGCASLIIGILSMAGVLVSLIPFLNIMNCVALPIAAIGVTLALLDLIRQKAPGEGRGMAASGLILNVIAMMIGIVRFLISFLTTGGIV